MPRSGKDVSAIAIRIRFDGDSNTSGLRRACRERLRRPRGPGDRHPRRPTPTGDQATAHAAVRPRPGKVDVARAALPSLPSLGDLRAVARLRSARLSGRSSNTLTDHRVRARDGRLDARLITAAIFRPRCASPATQTVGSSTAAIGRRRGDCFRLGIAPLTASHPGSCEHCSPRSLGNEAALRIRSRRPPDVRPIRRSPRPPPAVSGVRRGAVAGDDVAKMLLVSERQDGEVVQRIAPAGLGPA